MSATDTAHKAREHARAQTGRSVAAMPVLPASRWPEPPAAVPAEDLVWAEALPAGSYSSKVLARGTSVQFADRHGDACAHLLLFNAAEPWERLNVADTVKVPWHAYAGEGHPLLSDQGRVLATITRSRGAHDALCGCSTKATSSATATARRTARPPAGRPPLLLAAAKHGLGPRDVAPSLSLFKGVHVEPDGGLRFDGSTGPGGELELRAELPLIALVANVPHPLDPRPRYCCSTLELVAWRAEPTGPADPLWAAAPEREQAYLNTASYADAAGLA
jgi:uncharacterized protein